MPGSGIHPPSHRAHTVALLLTLAGAALLPAGLTARQADPALRAVRLEAAPERLTVRVGETAPLVVRALDAAGQPVDVPIRVVGPRSALRVGAGVVEGLETGDHEVVATLVLSPGSDRAPPTLTIPVTVTWPAATSVEVVVPPGRPYQGVTLPHTATPLHADGSPRPDAAVSWRSSDPAVASVDAFGLVTVHGPGAVTISATFEGVTGRVEHRTLPFPGAELVLEGGADEVRTGDVQAFRAVVRDPDGRPVEGVPVTWAHTLVRTPREHTAASAHGQLEGGRFVADVPGVFAVTATAGPLTARRTFRVVPRAAVQELEVVGHGEQLHVRTTDFWVFEGRDGRDYALTGSKVSGGYAYVWDVTDPAAIRKTDSVRVDARAVNDLKVSPDARYATLTREGASDRRNGVVILDLADPAHPVVASEVVDGLTGGVHNAFPTETHLFALSNGDKYLILDVADLQAPRVVGEYDHPDSRVHDVWVHDGIAYSAEWETGIVVVDVGNGRWGGTPESPRLVTTYPLPSGRTHAVFPWVSASTGKLYVFAGDEIMSRDGLAWAGYPRSMGSYAERYDPATGTGGIPLATRGYIQVVDFTDPLAPEMVARYEVSEFGTHNIWVEDDKLYQGYYEGGLRVVDVSGELMGNLYTQGREISVFKPADPAGFAPNATMVWSAMPHKGYVFFSDTNSGLWAVKLVPRERPVS